MRESLLTIPLSDAFKDSNGVTFTKGCPLCRMRDELENHLCEYIMGAAMMEPDVRIETNKLGFCRLHFDNLLTQNNRLSLALMLNTLLSENRSDILKRNSLKNVFSQAEETRAEQLEKSCFICSNINRGMKNMLRTVFYEFEHTPEFKEIFISQEFYCIPHYNLLIRESLKLSKKGKKQKAASSEFIKTLDEINSKYMEKLNSDVNEFCDSFDYRNAGKLHSSGMEEVRTSVCRAIEFFTGRECKE